MKRFVAFLGGAAALAGGGFALWRYGLSEGDRKAVSDLGNAARALFEEVQSRLEPVAAQTAHSSEAERVANREDTRRQWEELGY